MKSFSGYRIPPLVLVPLLLATALLMVGFCKSVLVLEIGGLGVGELVSPGDVFVVTYTHSMYQAPVHEKFKIEDRQFTLVHVMTQSDAALAYLGIEGKDEPNVNRSLTEFNIPAASMGNYVLKLHDRDIPLGTGAGRKGTIRVRLLRVPLIMYFARFIRR
jgi:uncharacterized membrane protein